MGSYNVACSISHISIDVGDPIVFIPLERSKYTYSVIGDGNTLFSTVNTYYSPACFPIKGIYDWYGGIEQIEDNNEKKFNENWYKKSINDIWETRENSNRPENIVSGMFVHYEIYNLLISQQVDEFGSRKNKYILTYENLDPEFDKLNIQMRNEKEKEIRMGFDLKYLYTTIFSPLIFRDTKTMNEMAINCLENGKMKKELIELCLFQEGMFNVNSFYFPALNGLQYGNRYMSRMLYKKCSEIIQQKINKR